MKAEDRIAEAMRLADTLVDVAYVGGQTGMPVSHLLDLDARAALEAYLRAPVEGEQGAVDWTPPMPVLFEINPKDVPKQYAAYTVGQLHEAYRAGLAATRQPAGRVRQCGHPLGSSRWCPDCELKERNS